jgi:hypothetical protein
VRKERPRACPDQRDSEYKSSTSAADKTFDCGGK